MKKTMLLAAAAVAALAVSAPAGAAVVFGDLSLTTYSYAYASGNVSNANSYQSDYGSQSDYANVLSSLYVEASSDAKAKKAGSVIAEGTADEQLNATLTSAAAGTFQFLGDTTAYVSPGVNNGYAAGYAYGQYLSYNFSTTANAVLNVAYALNESYFGYPYFQLYDNTASSYLVSSYLSPNTSGSMSQNLYSGHSYNLYIYNYYNVDYSSQSGPGSSAGHHEELYDWSITSVPEPASWALMIMGMGGLGAVMRRRRALAFA